MMDDFAVGRPLLWAIGPFVVIPVLLYIAWGLADQRYEGARRTSARATLLLGAVLSLFAGIAHLRPPVRVAGDTMTVTWFPFTTDDYKVSDVRFFDLQNIESGVDPLSQLEPHLLIVFTDGAYTEVNMKLDNANRLRAYLLRHGVHEGLPVGQRFQRE